MAQTKGEKKIKKVMTEFKKGTLHSGKSKKIVKSPKQAKAIALSEARKVGANIPIIHKGKKVYGK